MPQLWFPHPLQLIVDGTTYRFETGMQRVPQAIANHWWLVKNGVSAIRPM